MANDTFMGKIRSFLGFPTDIPKNDFRNPIWGSDDDDDGDELYTRQQTMEVYSEVDLHHMLTKHMQEMFRSFGGLFGDMRSFFHEDFTTMDAFTSVNDLPVEPENFDSNSIRDYYLKPGYHNRKMEEPKDIDLDGKISSQQISGLLKQKEDTPNIMTVKPFDGSLVPGRSFCQTVITTSVTKPDGTIETRRIVKSGNEIIEETTTSSTPDARSPTAPGLNPISSTGIILSELASMFKNFY